jgi:uncharacterized membrane protein YdjX (TVP38/TMEM64 family)
MILEFWQGTLEALKGAPMWVYFLGLVLLPLVGMPVSPLWILAGVIHGHTKGMLLGIGALGFNFALGYWMARSLLRAPIERWLVARGRTVPLIPPQDEWLWIVLLRSTPGIPLFVQNYMLGLARVRFGLYLLLSFPIQIVYVTAFVMVGESLVTSSLWRGLLIGGGILAVSVGVSLLRRHLLKRIGQGP